MEKVFADQFALSVELWLYTQSTNIDPVFVELASDTIEQTVSRYFRNVTA